MIHLEGGNDGFNTLIPYTSKAYYQSRPSIAVPVDEVIKLTDRYGLNPAMESLMEIYNRGNLLFLNSVGHPVVETSHYNALKIWQTGCACPDGEKSWLDRCNNHSRSAGHISFLNANTDSPDTESLHGGEYSSYSASDFDQGLRKVSVSINSGSATQVYHVSLDGFDTHQMQRTKHDHMLRAYADGISGLVQDLTESGQMDNTLIVTYSEFGRSLKENNKRGTEHGNANCVWMIGSGLKQKGIFNDTEISEDAGLACSYSSTDVYATILQGWFGVSSKAIFSEKHTVMNWV